MSTGKKIRAMLATLMGTGMIAFSAHAKNSLFIVINDHLGTPQMLIDEHKNIVWHAEYDEFGKADILVEKTEFNLRFPGQYYDKETGLHYNYYRDYDPALGRYSESDPIGLAGGINTYAYVGGNPVNRIDPFGLLERCTTGISSTGGYDLGPFEHNYQCWTDINGVRVCKGFSFNENSNIDLMGKIFGSNTGQVLPDEASNEAGAKAGETDCTKDDENSCMDSCAEAMWSLETIQPSQYGLIRANTCNDVEEYIYQHCKSVC